MASFITSSWYDTYSSFKGDRDVRIRLSRTNYEKFLIIFNILVYLSLFVLFILFIVKPDSNIEIAITALIFITLITVTGLLIGVGRKFFKRVLKRINHKGEAMKSSASFKIIFVFLVFCCIVRSLEQLLIIYSQSKKILLVSTILRLLSMDQSKFGIVYVLSSILFNVIGESGTAVSLILIINVNAGNSKNQISERYRIDRSKLELESDLDESLPSREQENIMI